MKLLPRATMLAFALATALLAAPRVPAQSTPGEVLYLSDVVNIGDSRSRLYTVTLNATNGRAELTLLPNGEIPFDLVFAVAALPNGSRIYAVDSLTPGFGNGSGRLGYYDVAAATFTVVGPVVRTDLGTTVQDVVQAAFSPSGELFILNNSSNVFRVDVTTAQATFLGQVRNQATNAVLDVQGGDLAFDVAGNAFIFTRFGTANAPRGLYRVMLPGAGGTVPAIFVGGGYTGTISGMAFRANGTGALIASSDSDNTVVTLDTTTGAVVGAAFPLFLNGTPFDHADGGDMSTGLLNRPPMTNTLAAAADTYVRGGAPNTNEGGAAILRIQDSGDNRALVRFDQAAIAALVAGRPVLSARLQLTITQIANNWGPTGRTVDAHRLTANWVEGNGFDEDNPPPRRGSGPGATWNCAIDSDIANQQANCSGATAWEMGMPNMPQLRPWAATPTSTVTLTNGQSGMVEFDVTADIQQFLTAVSPNYGWLIKKTNEGQAGRVHFASRESANGPRLLITVAP